MKKILSILVVIIVLLLTSGYVEISYCHGWVTTPPHGKTIQESQMIAKDYSPDNVLCRINNKVSAPGALLLALIL